ncbi:YopX family protein [Paenibacillus larvae]|nr:YopX family protein [Paenibacillus larvae]MDT2259628.1 YopX family protein [Paenibacillus larvae]MDT2275142.1 YopX family protein [Paenibacillus larvae]
MNRTIKFRACYIPTRKMFDMEDLIYEEHLIDMLTMVNGKSKEDFSPLMQFTGFYDTNGIEIFEDDIVEIKNHPFDRFIGVDGIYKVRYDKDMNICCKAITNLNDFLLSQGLPYVSVIGNIYQDPHLLGGTEDES